MAELLALCLVLLVLLGVMSWVAFRKPPSDKSVALLSLGLRKTRSSKAPAASSEIPRLLHQVWIGPARIPDKYRTCQKSWKRLNPDLEYRFHDDSDCDQLVRRHYPQYLDTYLGLPTPVERADMFRYMAVHHYGGIYADMDTTCRRQLHPLFTPEDRVVVAVENDKTGQYQILQWCFAARPGQPVFLRMLDEIVVRHNYMKDKPVHQRDKDNIVLWKTGPARFTEYLLRAKKQDDKAVTIHPRCTFGAYDLSSACLSKAYLIHHFDGSWKENWQERFKLWGAQ